MTESWLASLYNKVFGSRNKADRFRELLLEGQPVIMSDFEVANRGDSSHLREYDDDERVLA